MFACLIFLWRQNTFTSRTDSLRNQPLVHNFASKKHEADESYARLEGDWTGEPHVRDASGTGSPGTTVWRLQRDTFEASTVSSKCSLVSSRLEASVRLGHKSLRTLMKMRSKRWKGREEPRCATASTVNKWMDAEAKGRKINTTRRSTIHYSLALVSMSKD